MLRERNIKLYLDTSIINFAVSEQGVAKEKEVTLQLFEQIRRGRFEAGISEVVLREISRAPEKKLQDLMEVLKKTPLVNLTVSEDAERLAEIEAGLAELDAGEGMTLEAYEREMDAFMAELQI